jgi:hypothetical protein
LRERVTAYPGLTGRRLLREFRKRGYAGGYTAVTDMVREIRPAWQVLASTSAVFSWATREEFSGIILLRAPNRRVGEGDQQKYKDNRQPIFVLDA